MDGKESGREGVQANNRKGDMRWVVFLLAILLIASLALNAYLLNEPEVSKININTADVEQLQKIIHIGPSRAEVIIGKRPFDSLDALTRISGIGPSRLQDIKDQGVAYVE